MSKRNGKAETGKVEGGRAEGAKKDAPVTAGSAAGDAAVTPVPAPAWLRVTAFAVAAAMGLLLVVLFALALPDFIRRAQSGERLARTAACDALGPADGNVKLGRIPTQAPDFTLKDWSGRETSLSSLKGSVVLVNFWATWCSTCVVEVPSMERLVGRMKGKPFRLLAVSVDDDWATVRKYFAKGTPLEVLLDKERKVPTLWGTEKFPESFLVDKDGNIRYYIVSNRDWDTGTVEACLTSMMD
jgi:peroxiredoxin